MKLSLADQGYLGQCMCGADAIHTVWCEFTNPEPYPASVQKLAKEAGMELPKAPKGVWHNVCEACVKPTDRHMGA